MQIYSGCDEAYRLTQSGNLNVPPEATELFCNGPCLAETRLALSCINDVISDFLFYNKATVRDINYARVLVAAPLGKEVIALLFSFCFTVILFHGTYGLTPRLTSEFDP